MIEDFACGLVVLMVAALVVVVIGWLFYNFKDAAITIGITLLFLVLAWAVGHELRPGLERLLGVRRPPAEAGPR